MTCFELQSLAVDVNFSVSALNFIFPVFTLFIIEMQVQRSGSIVIYQGPGCRNPGWGDTRPDNLTAIPPTI